MDLRLLTLVIQIAYSRYYSRTIGPKVGLMYILGSIRLGRCRDRRAGSSSPKPGSEDPRSGLKAP